jgi:hypothetical protein
MMKKHILQILSIGLFLSLVACGDSSVSLGADSAVLDDSQVEPSSIAQSVANVEPWQGEARGYVVSDEENNRITITVRLGQILSAVGLYNNTGAQVGRITIDDVSELAAIRLLLTSMVNAEQLNLYKSIQSNFSDKDNERIIELLSQLAKPEIIANFTSPGYENRDLRASVSTSIRQLNTRIEAVLDKFYPSRHEYLLGSSALLREAGGMVAGSVAADGRVRDVGLLLKASSLIRSSKSLNPSRVNYCDAQRIPLDQHREAIYELADSLYARDIGDVIAVTATQVYALAERAQVAAGKFPIRDTEKCV